VAAKFFYWKRQIEEHGLEAVMRIPGYHDEPLKGKLRGHVRSVRMALGYRAYYRVVGTAVEFILVEEVNRHDYKEIERLFRL
jgi:proteic killer suppression protein